jgi:hypothetical protein
MPATATPADDKFDEFALVIRFSLEKNQISGILCRFSSLAECRVSRSKFQT